MRLIVIILALKNNEVPQKYMTKINTDFLRLRITQHLKNVTSMEMRNVWTSWSVQYLMTSCIFQTDIFCITHSIINKRHKYDNKQPTTDGLVLEKKGSTILDCKGLNVEQVVDRFRKVDGMGGAAGNGCVFAEQSGKTISQFAEWWAIFRFYTPAWPHQVLEGARRAEGSVMYRLGNLNCYLSLYISYNIFFSSFSKSTIVLLTTNLHCIYSCSIWYWHWINPDAQTVHNPSFPLSSIPSVSWGCLGSWTPVFFLYPPGRWPPGAHRWNPTGQQQMETSWSASHTK